MFARLLLLAGLSLSPLSLAKVTLVDNVKGYSFSESGAFMQFSALAFEKGKVVAVGDQHLAESYPQATRIDGNGQVLLPGLIDAHGHVLGLGNNLLQVDIRDLASEAATVEKVTAYAKANPDLAWIIGRGWNQVLWPGKTFPTKDLLDENIGERPVWLERVDGHAGWANSKALELAGIDSATLDPPGGKIVKDASGEPTGLLIDNAARLVENILPQADQQRLNQALNAAGKHLLSLGITSTHDAGIPKEVYELYQARAMDGSLPLRIYAMIAATDDSLAPMLARGPVGDKQELLSIRSVKAYGDGALGSRGAALLADYSDDAGNRGLLVTKQNNLQPLFDQVIGSGFQLNFHAIGDRANRLALDQFADTFARIGGQQLRHRIEHAQVIHPDDIPRFKTLNIIPSMQPTHATSDMNMAGDRLGDARLRGAYAWRTFVEQGSRIAGGSDYPVELANPFYGLHAAVTRQNRANQPQQGWRGEEGLSVYQAFKAFTLDAAYAAHQEQTLGTLEPGNWADFILVDQDIFAIAPQDIWRTQVLQTWLAGKRVYKR